MEVESPDQQVIQKWHCWTNNQCRHHRGCVSMVLSLKRSPCLWLIYSRVVMPEMQLVWRSPPCTSYLTSAPTSRAWTSFTTWLARWSRRSLSCSALWMILQSLKKPAGRRFIDLTEGYIRAALRILCVSVSDGSSWAANIIPIYLIVTIAEEDVCLGH